ncbi:MAG: dimethylarginine dimethylaminohydrolase family protein [Actinomycetota bacterium]
MGGRVVMAEADHYEVCYTINPWMRPEMWSQDLRRLAAGQWRQLAERLEAAGLTVERVPAVPGLPDLVFPANAAVVLDGRALLARFRHPERRGEEAHFRRFFDGLRDRALLAEVRLLPEEVFQEGAGDCLWDATRGLFWAAWGPRSTFAATAELAAFFEQAVVPLELVTARYYHLDTCFLPLSGGEVVYYPPAFSGAARAAIAERVPADMLVAASDDEAAAFSLNAVNIGRDLVMTAPPARLRAILEERGYRVHPVDLSAFVLSGGAAFCMTLRLDLTSGVLLP